MHAALAQVSLLRGDSFEEARGTVKRKLKGVVTTGWRFWPFVHIFTYFLIPPRHRVLWVRGLAMGVLLLFHLLKS